MARVYVSAPIYLTPLSYSICSYIAAAVALDRTLILAYTDHHFYETNHCLHRSLLAGAGRKQVIISK